jgi:hypothetical protein
VREEGDMKGEQNGKNENIFSQFSKFGLNIYCIPGPALGA